MRSNAALLGAGWLFRRSWRHAETPHPPCLPLTGYPAQWPSPSPPPAASSQPPPPPPPPSAAWAAVRGACGMLQVLIHTLLLPSTGANVRTGWLLTRLMFSCELCAGAAAHPQHVPRCPPCSALPPGATHPLCLGLVACILLRF